MNLDKRPLPWEWGESVNFFLNASTRKIALNWAQPNLSAACGSQLKQPC